MFGGILSADAIRKAVAKKKIVIEPFLEARLNPNSYDLRLNLTNLKGEIILAKEKSIKYDKLIRDRIPEIIATSGKRAVIEILNNDNLVSLKRAMLIDSTALF